MYFDTFISKWAFAFLTSSLHAQDNVSVFLSGSEKKGVGGGGEEGRVNPFLFSGLFMWLFHAASVKGKVYPL